MELFFIIYINDDWSDFVYWMEEVKSTGVTLSNLSSLTDRKLSTITYYGPFYYLQIVVAVTSLASAGSAGCTMSLPDDCMGQLTYQPGYIGASIAIGFINTNTKTFGLRNCSSGAMTGNLDFNFILYRKF